MSLFGPGTELKDKGRQHGGRRQVRRPLADRQAGPGHGYADGEQHRRRGRGGWFTPPHAPPTAPHRERAMKHASAVKAA